MRHGLRDLVVELVQALPHFRADLFPHLAGIFPSCRDAGDNGGAIVRLSEISWIIAVSGSSSAASAPNPRLAVILCHLCSVETLDGLSIRL